MTSRRNIFRLAISALAASAMDVFGLKEIKAPEFVFPVTSFERWKPYIMAANRSKWQPVLDWVNFEKPPTLGQMLSSIESCPVQGRRMSEIEKQP